MFRDQPLVVVGGGDTAMEEAMFLTRFASKVYLVHRRDVFRASKIMYERVAANPKVEIIVNAQVDEVIGENSVEAVRVKDTQDGSTRTLDVAGMFVAIGHQPNTGFLMVSLIRMSWVIS